MLALLLIGIVVLLAASSGSGGATASSGYGYSQPYSYSGGGSDLSGTDQDIMARTLWGEARNQSQEAMQGVASVIINRMRDPAFPNSVQGVCLAPYQFSCWNAGDSNRAKLQAVTTSDPQFRLCLQIASSAIAGALPDNTGGAEWYYDTSIARPGFWNTDRIVETRQIGAFIFGRK